MPVKIAYRKPIAANGKRRANTTTRVVRRPNRGVGWAHHIQFVGLCKIRD
jgi:hypothetical protein